MYTYTYIYISTPIDIEYDILIIFCFAKEPYKRDYILQKRLIILRSLLLAATP